MRTAALPWDLGHVTPLNAAQTCDWILGPAPESSRPRILGNLNLHALYLTLETGPVRDLTAMSDVTLIDGWPILLLAKLTTRTSEWPTTHERIGSTDWLAELLARDPAIDVVAVGGTPETAEHMAQYVGSRTRNIRWRHYDGYSFSNQGETAATDSLSDALAQADLILVGLGMPTQEKWILDHLGAVTAGAVIANVGGCFDYFVGTQRLAPRWMGRFGLEWLFRLIHSPRRLAKRYLIEPFLLITRLVRRGMRRHA